MRGAIRGQWGEEWGLALRPVVPPPQNPCARGQDRAAARDLARMTDRAGIPERPVDRPETTHGLASVHRRENTQRFAKIHGPTTRGAASSLG